MSLLEVFDFCQLLILLLYFWHNVYTLLGQIFCSAFLLPQTDLYTMNRCIVNFLVGTVVKRMGKRIFMGRDSCSERTAHAAL